MAHISLSEGQPGIRGLLELRSETAKPLTELADVLLHQPHSLSPAERELTATYVSSRNDCYYCQTSHGAIAAYHHVDGLGTWAPDDLATYRSRAADVASGGYNRIPADIRAGLESAVGA